MIGAMLLEQNDEWQLQHRYIQVVAMAELVAAIRGLANFTRSTAPSNGMNAQRSAGGPLSSPAAAQRCAEGAGLDSGPPAAAQSTMPSIATPCRVSPADHFPPRPSTSLTDVTQGRHLPTCCSVWSNPWLEPICWLRL
jgi:hypothetical protein